MITIITPVLNEQDNIQSFIQHLTTLEGDFEVIIVDGGSTDTTPEEIQKNIPLLKKKLTFITTLPGRGHQMNTGARQAQGDILFFIHIDCTIQKNTLAIIENELKQHQAIGGGLTQKFTPTDQFLTLTSNFGNLRSKITQIFFGDCGIFLRKDSFDTIGGYDEIIFLEDVELCKKAKKQGKLIQIPATIYTSPRRYLHIGKIRVTIIFTLIYFLNSLGIRP
jgi:rSAM/selenodomain-associated transferase 2